MRIQDFGQMRYLPPGLGRPSGSGLRPGGRGLPSFRGCRPLEAIALPASRVDAANPRPRFRPARRRISSRGRQGGRTRRLREGKRPGHNRSSLESQSSKRRRCQGNGACPVSPSNASMNSKPGPNIRESRRQSRSAMFFLPRIGHDTGPARHPHCPIRDHNKQYQFLSILIAKGSGNGRRTAPFERRLTA